MTKPMFKLSPVAAAVLGVVFSSPSFGGEAIVFDNGAKLDWKAATTYTLATRLKSPDPLLLEVDGKDINVKMLPLI